MKKKRNKHVSTFRAHLDEQYGKKGTKSRKKYEKDFEVFQLGILIQEIREQKHLTQEQLAERCGTTKSYISRIENNNSDIRLSTLMRIITDGLGAHLKLSLLQ